MDKYIKILIIAGVLSVVAYLVYKYINQPSVATTTTQASSSTSTVQNTTSTEQSTPETNTSTEQNITSSPASSESNTTAPATSETNTSISNTSTTPITSTSSNTSTSSTPEPYFMNFTQGIKLNLGNISNPNPSVSNPNVTLVYNFSEDYYGNSESPNIDVYVADNQEMNDYKYIRGLPMTLTESEEAYGSGNITFSLEGIIPIQITAGGGYNQYSMLYVVFVDTRNNIRSPIAPIMVEITS